MRVITLAIFCSLAFFAICMPTEKQSAPDASQRDILDTLLPIFGNYKLNTIISARTIEFVRVIYIFRQNLLITWILKVFLRKKEIL